MIHPLFMCMTLSGSVSFHSVIESPDNVYLIIVLFETAYIYPSSTTTACLAILQAKRPVSL